MFNQLLDEDGHLILYKLLDPFPLLLKVAAMIDRMGGRFGFCWCFCFLEEPDTKLIEPCHFSRFFIRSCCVTPGKFHNDSMSQLPEKGKILHRLSVVVLCKCKILKVAHCQMNVLVFSQLWNVSYKSSKKLLV